MSMASQVGKRSSPLRVRKPRPEWHKLALFLLVSLTLVGVIAYLPDGLIGLPLDVLICAVLIAALVYIYPSRWTTVAAAGLVLSSLAFLRIANIMKASVTSFPLTSTDLRSVFATPTGFLAALGAPAWVQTAFCGMLYLALGLAAWRLFVALRRSGIRHSARRVLRAGLRILCAAAVLFALEHAVVKTVSSFHTAHKEIPIWHGDGLVLFSQRVGILGFLTYSSFFEQGERDHFLSYTPKEGPPPRADITTSVEKYVRTEKLDGVLPNIMIVHAESTFDPNDVLKLSTPVTNSLFYSRPDDKPDEAIQYRGPGIANVIGGGSWVSEFEVINGLDSRLFGTAGRYTHEALSAFSQHAFPRYLRDRGYDVAAFTPDSPTFFNSERAYRLYGFQDYYGNSGKDDMAIMSNAVDTQPSNPDAPFLKFVILTENHSPHWCISGHLAAYEKVEFVNPASPEQICALQEYLWRARSSEKAIALARAYLVKEQARTGRPYVIAVYGDHQPYTFTGGGESWSLGLDFSAHRKDESKRRTSLEFISSKENPFTDHKRDPVPLTLVPTMVSAYVANSPQTLYLPENYYQIDHCGSDWIGYLVGRLFYDEAETGVSQGNCDKYESLIAAYQQSKVLNREVAQTGGSAGGLFTSLASWTTGTKKPTAGQLVVDAAGTRYMGLPRVEVAIDDDIIGRLNLGNALDNTHRKAEAPEIYLSSQLSTLATPPCAHRITFRFVNDAYAGENNTGDRNVYLKSVTLDGIPVPLAPAKIEPADSGQVFNDGALWMWRNGSATIDVPSVEGCR